MHIRHVGFKSKSPSESESEEARQHLKRIKLGEVVPVVPMEIQESTVRFNSPSKSVRRKNEEKKQLLLQTLRDQMTRYREDSSQRSNDTRYDPCD